MREKEDAAKNAGVENASEVVYVYQLRMKIVQYARTCNVRASMS